MINIQNKIWFKPRPRNINVKIHNAIIVKIGFGLRGTIFDIIHTSISTSIADEIMENIKGDLIFTLQPRRR